jgi:hypothetical protein
LPAHSPLGRQSEWDPLEHAFTGRQIPTRHAI